MKTISFFSGAGGLDIGASQAGAEILCCVDNDADSMKTLAMNHCTSSAEHVLADIQSLTGDDILRRSKMRKGEVDLVIGGPPCQSFSKNNYWTKPGHESLRRKIRARTNSELNGNTFVGQVKLSRATKRTDVADDNRTSLVMEYARMIDEISPKGFVFENVSSINHPNNKRYLFEFIDFVEKLGYNTTTLNLKSEDYGVAQKRRRVFVLGHKEMTIGEPEITHAEEHVGGKLPLLTSKQALHPFRAKKYFEPEEVVKGRWAKYFSDIPPGMNYKALTSWAGYPNPVFQAETKFWNFLLKLHPEKPSWTIAANPGPWVGPFHWENRRLRTVEMAALQSFPSDYKFFGNRRSKVRQIGNAVPPLMAEAVVSLFQET